jgi:hypothetical protein
MYITTNERSSSVGAAPSPPRLHPRCYSLVVTVPATYAALEEAVRRWISTCVMSRTQVRPGVPIRRERTLVTGNPSLRNIWDRVLRHRTGQRVEIRAEYIWGRDREEAINFSTPAPPPPPPPPPPQVRPAPRQAPCPPPTCTPVGPFLPSRHGFKFDNLFSVTIPLPGPLPSISEKYGLCGGMATAALDYFLSCIPIPSTTTVPASGTTLFNYLLRRQLDSIDAPTFGMVRKFLSWTNRPDITAPLANVPFGPRVGRLVGPLIGPVPALVPIDGLQELTVPEFRATVASLSAGRPVVLGLIYVGPGAVSIWNNHQVLAYGATRVSPTVTNIRVYDPNEKGNNPDTDDVLIRCELLAGGTRVRCMQGSRTRVTKTVRGFFRMPYTRVTPPCLP